MEQKSPSAASTGHQWRAWLDGVASIAMIGVAGVLAWSVVHRPSPQPPARPPTVPVPADLISLNGAATVGSQSARVALLEYSDFECPYCGRFSRDTLPALTSRYLTPGLVQLAFRHLPAQQLHPHAEAAARSAICAGQQDRFWPMHDLLFANQSDLTDEGVTRLARAVGLDMVAYDACFKTGGDGVAATLIKRDLDEAKRLHVVATPTFLAGIVESDRQLRVRTVIQGAKTVADFSRVLDSLVNSGR